MADGSGLMRGKRGLIMGVANNRSIAWGIARACHAHGADLAFTYQGDALKKRVEPLAEEVDGIIVGHCDVSEPATIDAAFASYAAFPKPRLERIGLRDLVDRVVSVFNAPQREGLTFVTDVAFEGDYAVRADVDAMRRVFLNLFNNAYEAMGGRGTLTVRATVETSDGGFRALLTVSDTGKGIPPEDLPHLFEPYFSTRTGGTGLGLAICRKIVGEHDGSIAVASTPGIGATFTITLPCFRADAPVEPGDEAPFTDTRTLPRGG